MGVAQFDCARIMALEYKLLIVMIFQLAIFAVAHSAPGVNKRNGGVLIGDKIQQFYCSAEVLKLQVKDMIKVNNSWLGIPALLHVYIT